MTRRKTTWYEFVNCKVKTRSGVQREISAGNYSVANFSDFAYTTIFIGDIAINIDHVEFSRLVTSGLVKKV